MSKLGTVGLGAIVAAPLALLHPASTQAGDARVAAAREGQHDFDFAVGSCYWANARNGVIDSAPQTGQFADGRGEFYGQDTLAGKAIYVRFVWTNTGSAAPHFEQAYSEDGGKTWEVNWITEQTKVADASGRAH